MTERLRNARKAAEAQEAKRKHVQSFIDRFRCVGPREWDARLLANGGAGVLVVG